MTTQLTIDLPDDILAWLLEVADREFRTCDRQVLWFLHQAMTRSAATRQPGQRTETQEARLQRYQPVYQELRRAYLAAGKPSGRSIADSIRQRNAGGAIAHTTVSTVLSGDAIPSWPVLEKITTALRGDVSAVKKLWEEANKLGSRYVQR